MSSPAETISDAEIQALLARAVRLYAERVAARDEPLAAFPPGERPMTIRPRASRVCRL